MAQVGLLAAFSTPMSFYTNPLSIYRIFAQSNRLQRLHCCGATDAGRSRIGCSNLDQTSLNSVLMRTSAATQPLYPAHLLEIVHRASGGDTRVLSHKTIQVSDAVIRRQFLLITSPLSAAFASVSFRITPTSPYAAFFIYCDPVRCPPMRSLRHGEPPQSALTSQFS